MDPPKFVSLGDRVAGPPGTPRRVRSDRSPPVGQAVRIAASVASRTSTVRLVIVLGAVNAIGPLSIDMYLPGFPDIAAGLHTSASQVQLTLTACVAGLALGQLVIGPLSDRLGRRGPLLAAVTTYSAASVLCSVAPSVVALMGLRLLQGLAGAGGVVIARAVVR